MRLRLLAVALIAVLLVPQAAEAQRAVILVRHAEKRYNSDEPAVPLSEQGDARAQALAGLLKDAGITAIYSTRTIRTMRTAAPLAKELGLKVTLADQRDPEELLERIRKDQPNGVVLIVGHANTVPQLLRALGDTDDVGIPSSEYDNLFVVIPNGSGKTTVLRLRYPIREAH
jgi:broad specificity phosphatase PhoE